MLICCDVTLINLFTAYAASSLVKNKFYKSFEIWEVGTCLGIFSKQRNFKEIFGKSIFWNEAINIKIALDACVAFR